MLNDQYAIGLMSGSSLDGLDLCHVHFSIKDGLQFKYKILHTGYVPYSNIFREQLRQAPTLSAFQLANLHTELGRFFGEQTAFFIQKNKIKKPDFICSHGQTIFHQPKIQIDCDTSKSHLWGVGGFSTQIGCGASIAQITHTKTVADLRMSDVAAGGQGAPIVPIAEKYLFAGFDTFLNIGGICNISFHNKNTDNIIAYDVCAGNTLLNYLAKEKNKNYDENGLLARQGEVCVELLEQLNRIAFCNEKAPKSLGTEHVYQDWIALADQYNMRIEDKLATCVEHIALQINKQIDLQKNKNITAKNMLITGGGAFNLFLMERIKHHTNLNVIIPDKETIENKEALAIAFFGLLRILEIPNCLASVTGAGKDVIGGAVYL
jgi:anhydro-N-acetylmuramic acid kinase